MRKRISKEEIKLKMYEHDGIFEKIDMYTYKLTDSNNIGSKKIQWGCIDRLMNTYSVEYVGNIQRNTFIISTKI